MEPAVRGARISNLALDPRTRPEPQLRESDPLVRVGEHQHRVFVQDAHRPVLNRPGGRVHLLEPVRSLVRRHLVLGSRGCDDVRNLVLSQSVEPPPVSIPAPAPARVVRPVLANGALDPVGRAVEGVAGAHPHLHLVVGPKSQLFRGFLAALLRLLPAPANVHRVVPGNRHLLLLPVVVRQLHHVGNDENLYGREPRRLVHLNRVDPRVPQRVHRREHRQLAAARGQFRAVRLEGIRGNVPVHHDGATPALIVGRVLGRGFPRHQDGIAHLVPVRGVARRRREVVVRIVVFVVVVEVRAIHGAVPEGCEYLVVKLPAVQLGRELGPLRRLFDLVQLVQALFLFFKGQPPERVRRVPYATLQLLVFAWHARLRHILEHVILHLL